MPVLCISDAGRIQPYERDAEITLHDLNWPPNGLLSGRFDSEPNRCLSRVIEVKNRQLAESMVRFPSAPIYGINRKPQFQHKIDRINYHTLRFLKRPDVNQVSRVYLIYNGLNELTHFTFYYELADLLLTEDPSAACIIRPTPGHLTRYPFDPVFSETPLERYLSDSGDLFRQFIRNMVETQWLLSILAPLKSYPFITGLRLLCEGSDATPGRNDDDLLAGSLYAEWKSLASASGLKNIGKPITDNAIKEIVGTIRSLVRGQQELTPKQNLGQGDVSGPSVHAIGYSLGGVYAQSMFFTWPFAVSSCTTLCSGGLLSEVALTKFADPEEWQTVMQLLRYELDSSLIEGRLGFDKKRMLIAGINKKDFAYLHEMFYEVFVRQLVGEYKSRVDEYVQRLLFIMGGGDLIVRSESVLDASPAGGVNLLQLAGMSHFMPAEKNDDWKNFWLPEVCRLVSKFSSRAEKKSADTLRKCIEAEKSIRAKSSRS